MHLISERHLDPFHTLVRISIDAGGSFLKVIVNVFEPNSESGKFLNSGVQRCQILTVTEDVPESNFNLRTILENLNLQDVHILLCHVEPFVLSHKCGLGRYAEVGE